MQILLAAQDLSDFCDWEDNCMDARSNGTKKIIETALHIVQSETQCSTCMGKC